MPKAQRRTLPLAFIGCGKNVVAQNPFAMWLKQQQQQALHIPPSQLHFHETLSTSPATLSGDRLLLTSRVGGLYHVCGWVFLFAFSFLCNKKVSCIVPAHCFAACSLLSTSSRLAIIVEAKSGAGRRRKDEENPLHETVEHLFAQLIRELLLIVVYRPIPSNLHFDHVSFFPHIEEKVFCAFLLSKHSFSNHIVFGVWSERIDGNSSGGTIVLCLKEMVTV